jgi:hypothetical protein
MFTDRQLFTELDIITHPGMALIIIPDPGPGDLILDIHHISDGASAGDIVQDGLV